MYRSLQSQHSTPLTLDRVGINDDGSRVGLRADEVVRAVAASVAVGRDIALGREAESKAQLVVDVERKLGRLAVLKSKPVLALAASDDLRRKTGVARRAVEVRGVLAAQLERDGLDAVVLADIEVIDVDVLVGVRVRRRRRLRRGGSGSGNGAEESSSGSNGETHVDDCCGGVGEDEEVGSIAVCCETV